MATSINAMNTQALLSSHKRSEVKRMSAASIKTLTKPRKKSCGKSVSRNKKSFDFVGLAG